MDKCRINRMRRGLGERASGSDNPRTPVFTKIFYKIGGRLRNSRQALSPSPLRSFIFAQINRKNFVLGFTLVEVLFAVAALSFGLTTLLRSFLISLEGIKRFEDTLAASYLLEEKMEAVKDEARQFDGIATGQQSGQFEYETGKNFKFSWALDVEGSSFGKKLNEVKLVVSWPVANRTRQLTAVTLIESLKEDE